MRWSPQQSRALIEAKAWASSPRGPQVKRLFGWAGTGKTTMAQELAAEVDGTVLFGAFTGKAALVLRKKGCDAHTLHSTIYKPRQDETTGKVEFILNAESPLAYASLMIVDEVSMVNEDLGRDLLSFGTKILVLGDPFQLPPVQGGGFFTAAEPDWMLTEIHRQAEDNPIIRMSMDVREGRGLQLGNYGSSSVRARLDVDREELARISLQADQVLCGRNKTRQGLNARMRELQGYGGPIPQAGERLICLRNDKMRGLLNGGMWTVKESKATHFEAKMIVDSIDDDQRDLPVMVRREFFAGTEAALDWRERKRSDEFTYGYAITCHKSQGSQWDAVAVFDESEAFREHSDRWLYTAITRAADQVHVFV